MATAIRDRRDGGSFTKALPSVTRRATQVLEFLREYMIIGQHCACNEDIDVTTLTHRYMLVPTSNDNSISTPTRVRGRLRPLAGFCLTIEVQPERPPATVSRLLRVQRCLRCSVRELSEWFDPGRRT
eukprot:scaffold82071_cov63-Phaeocystis_antarctica.AAC.2